MDYKNLLKPLYIKLENISCKELKHQSVFKNISSFLPSNLTNSLKNLQKNENITKYICSHVGCDKLFGKKSRLIVHERTHTGERPFKCPYDECSRSYTRRFHLTRHITVSHTSSQKNSNESYSCDYCPKVYANIYAKKKHETQFHKRDRYVCKECGQHFRKQHCLKNHSYTHTGIRQYACDVPGCGKTYTNASRLKRHALSHVKGRYPCSYEGCLHKMDTYTELRHHIRSAHPKICDVCHQQFEQLCRLKSHLLSHEEMREAAFCPFAPCERYYFNEKNLHSHIQKKHNENFKGFECPLCNKWLVSKQALKRHLITHDDSAKSQEKPKVAKPRKPRKDKGISKTNYAKLLSGYSSDMEADTREKDTESG